MEDIKIPRYIDEVPALTEEGAVFVSVSGVGILMGGLWMIPAMIVGYLVVRKFRRFKEGQPPGVLRHMAYWGGWLLLNKIYNNGLDRDLVL